MDDEYEKEIDLGKEVPDYEGPENVDSAPEAKGNTTTIYPRLYISNAEELKDLPDEGCCKIKYRKVRTVTHEVEDEDGAEKNVSCELEIMRICLTEGEDGEEDDNGDLEEKVRKFMEEQEKD